MKQEAAEMLNNYGGDLRENYSGRGMYGKETFALTFDSENDFYECLADAIEGIDADEDEGEKEKDIIADMLRSLKTDSMGKGIIIY